MTDVLVRDVPEHVIAALDARAARMGLSRSEYLRRRLAQEAAATAEGVSVEHLSSFAQTFADLADPEVMKGAWEERLSHRHLRPGPAVTNPDAVTWAERVDRGLVRITTVTRLEVGYSARSEPALRTAVPRPPLASMPVEHHTSGIEDRAVEAQTLLADRGRQHAP